MVIHSRKPNTSSQLVNKPVEKKEEIQVEEVKVSTKKKEKKEKKVLPLEEENVVVVEEAIDLDKILGEE